MPRSTSRGRSRYRREDRRASAEVVLWGTCAACGGRLGGLQPFELLAGGQTVDLGPLGGIAWWGSVCAAPPWEPTRPLMRPVREMLDALGDYLARQGMDVPPPPRLAQDMFDHRRRRMQCPQCGATPIYTQAALRAKYDAARAAGQRTVEL